MLIGKSPEVPADCSITDGRTDFPTMKRISMGASPG